LCQMSLQEVEMLSGALQVVEAVAQVLDERLVGCVAFGFVFDA
jgi:hypothetical protein